ncbi:MAG: translocation/assembly module TamB domain-containing protein, partial [Rhodanobacter sp.]
MTTQTSHQNATNAGPTNGMKWLKRVGLALLVLLLLLVAAGGWLLGTGAGLRFTLAQLQSATHGALQVQQASGRLAGPLDLTGIHYDDGNGTVASVAKLHLDLRIWPLLAKRVHVVALDLDGVEVALPTAPVDTAVDDGSAFSLRPPVELILDQIHVGKVRLSRAGEPLFGSDSLDLAGSWTNQGITLRQLALKAPDGHADLTGKLALSTQVQGNGSASFAWKLDDTDYAGDLTARSDGKQATLQLKLTAPTVI